ncbi:zinc-ribbon domain-containing protein [Arthrobacter sp. AK01]|uniref:zinc-ribbon domain-containing protein n=1 Tax=Arthrobacter sp. AK01 TaxID=2894084 RepID=UPI0035AB71B8
MKKGSITLQEAEPDLAAEWHPTLNGDLKPASVWTGYKGKIWWLGECGHHWDAVIYSRRAGTGCPYCAGVRIGFGNDLASNYPDLAKEWHPTKNAGLEPTAVAPRSNRKVWWVGSDCGHEWEAVIANRTNKSRSGCPYCSNQKVGFGNDLASHNPELAAEWHPTLNGDLRPDEVTAKARRNVWWRCSRGHEWRAMIFKRAAGADCERCRLVGVSELEVAVFMELDEVLSSHIKRREQDVRVRLPNGRTLRVDMIFDDLVVEFDGSYWHSGKEGPDREKTEDLNSLGFSVVRVRENPLSPITALDVVVRRAPTAVEVSGVVLEQMVKAGLLPVEARSDVDKYLLDGVAVGGNETSRRIAALRSGDYGARSLAARFPDVASEWHPEKNGDLTPQQVTGAAGRKVWWLCPSGHSYEAKIDQRTGKGTGCGYCSGRYPTSRTSLAALRPELADLWHPTLNGELEPQHVTPHSKRSVWWLCPQGHETEDRVSDRTKGMVCQGCPNSRRREGQDEAGRG